MSRQRQFDFAFSCDTLLLSGLQITLSTVLKRWAASGAPTCWLFQDGIATDQIDRLSRSLLETGRSHHLRVERFSSSQYRSLRTLHGISMPYGRICLADLLSGAGRLVYLDSDLVVGRHLAGLFDLDLGRNGLAAVAPGPMGESLDRQFFRDLGLEDRTPGLNSGLLVLDLVAWRRDRIGSRLLEFAERHRDRLRSADQAALNGFLRGEFVALPGHYNVALYPNSEPVVNLDGIVAHFVGSPKPFDPLGTLFHRNAGTYTSELEQVPRELRVVCGLTSARQLRRIVRLGRSYWRNRNVPWTRLVR